MRPITNFALHAIAAAVLTAFAATSAAAEAARFSLVAASFKNAGGNYAPGRKDEIEILSYSFGATQSVAKVDGFAVKQGVKPGKDGAKGGNVEFEWKVEEGESAPPPPGGVRVATGDLDGDGRADVIASEGVGGAPAASGLPTGKRQHKPMSFTKPLDRGSVTLKGKLPGCAVGAAYPDAVLQTASARYELKEVIITSCAMESVSLNYAKVQVRGWDPASKQE